MVSNEFEDGGHDAEERVQGVIRDILGTDDVPRSASLAEVGVNSLSFIRMVVDLERVCEMRFEDDDIDLARFHTVDDLVRYVAAGASAGAGRER